MKKKIKKVQAEEVSGLLEIPHIPDLKIIPIKTRRFIQFDFDFTNEIFIPKINPDEIKDAVVKITMRVKQEDAHLFHWLKDLDNFIRKHAYYLKPIIPIVVKAKKVRNVKINADIGAIDAVRLWLADKKPNNEAEILALAEEIIREEGRME